MVVFAIPVVELARRYDGPAALLASSRARGRRSPCRSAEQRARLQKIIRILDRLVPGGQNCFRRVLVETTLDARAAEETIFCGLRVGGHIGSGHAWIGAQPQQTTPTELYDAVLPL
jgi:hypothetical protein